MLIGTLGHFQNGIALHSSSSGSAFNTEALKAEDKRIMARKQ